MSSPQLYAIVYGSPGYIQTQTLSHNQTADDVSASFSRLPHANAPPAKRPAPRPPLPARQRHTDEDRRRRDQLYRLDRSPGNQARAHQAGTLFNQPALKRPTTTISPLRTIEVSQQRERTA